MTRKNRLGNGNERNNMENRYEETLVYSNKEDFIITEKQKESLEKINKLFERNVQYFPSYLEKVKHDFLSL